MSQTNYFPTIVGLCIAFSGTALPVNKLFGNPEGFAARVLEQGFHWQWRSVAWGFLLTVVMMLVTAPLGDWAVRERNSRF